MNSLSWFLYAIDVLDNLKVAAFTGLIVFAIAPAIDVRVGNDK